MTRRRRIIPKTPYTPAMRQDGYENTLTRLGTTTDPTTHTFFKADPIIPINILEDIFISDGLGRQIVEGPAEDMCREWFTIDGKGVEGILDTIEEMGAEQAFIEGATWARLYGGSLMVFILNDGSETLEQPVNEAALEEVVGIRIYDCTKVRRDTNTRSKDPIRLLLGEPEFYNVTGIDGKQLRIHESRCVVIPGKRTSEDRRKMNGGWDLSVLQACWTSLQRYGTTMGYTANILKDFVQAVLGIKGLSEIMAAGNENQVESRVRLLDMSKSLLNTIILDSDGEQFSKSSSSVSGIPELTDRLAEHLAATTRIPVTKLFGRSPSGQNSTGESDMRNYYDMLGGEQRRMLTPAAERFVRFIFLSKQGPTGGKEPDQWSVRWNSPMKATRLEVAGERKIYAEIDQIYLNTGVLSPMEIAASRFGTGSWSAETQLIEDTDRSEDAEIDGGKESRDVEQNVKAKGGRGHVTQNSDALNEDTAPRTLYVRRDVVNKREIAAWAREQGIILEDDYPLHVTIAYSKTPIDWMKVEEDWNHDTRTGNLDIAPGGARSLERFGPTLDVLVLAFNSSKLSWRHEAFLRAGASYDWDEYQPHITLIKEAAPDLDLKAIEPYRGKIVLGPEIFEELK